MLESLYSVCSDSIRESASCCCTVATSAWLEQAHSFGRVGGTDIQKLLESKAEDRKESECINFFLGYSQKVVPGDDIFPGPLCSPFRRKHISLVKNSPYWLTEKSDGQRIILLLLRCASFPVWSIARETGEEIITDLRHISALEEAALGGPKSEEGAASFSLLPLGEEDRYQLSLNGSNYVVTRSTKAVLLAYGVDRLMNRVYAFYSILPVSDSVSYSEVILDGELMQLCQEDGVLRATSAISDWIFDVFFPLELPERENKDGMSHRYKQLRQVVESLSGSYRSFSLDGSLPVHWFVKEMWYTDSFNEGFHSVKKVNDNVYTVQREFGTTLNDGFIFTPEYFPVVSGSSKDQLKWKWKAFLSVDLFVRSSPGASPRLFSGCFFRKKRYGHSEDSTGHWFIDLPLENPKNIPVSPKGSVMECRFNPVAKEWSIEQERKDKDKANSIITILSVMESLLEDITLSELKTPPEAPTPPCEKTAAPTGTPCGKKFPTASFSLRATTDKHGESKLHLVSYTTTQNSIPKFKLPLPFNFIEVGDCAMALNTPENVMGGERLENFLNIELANAGGSGGWSDFIVRASFNAEKGMWFITHLEPHGDNKQCGFDRVARHLMYLLSLDEEEKTRFYRQVSFVKRSTSSIQNQDTQRTNLHYGKVAVAESKLPDQSRSGLRIFNNWVKSMKLRLTSQLIGTPLYALDACCGRGGDLPKWKHLKPNYVFFVDSSEQCVAAAAHRYSTGLGTTKVPRSKDQGYPAHFTVRDVFDPESGLLEDIVAVKKQHKEAFNLVSCQFSVHYGCSSSERLLYFLQCVSTALIKGGFFIGTTVSDKVLLKSASEKGPQFGNSVYHIHLTEETLSAFTHNEANRFGLQYFTSVEHLVQDTPEYVVPWGLFCDLCSSVNLVLVKDESLLEFFEAHIETEEGKELYTHHSKRSRDGKPPPLSTDEKEAVSLYRVFSFRKE